MNFLICPLTFQIFLQAGVFLETVSYRKSLYTVYVLGPNFRVGFIRFDLTKELFFYRLHSAGHLLDVCMQNVGLGHLEPSKGYHFPDGYEYGYLFLLILKWLSMPYHKHFS